MVDDVPRGRSVIPSFVKVTGTMPLFPWFSRKLQERQKTEKAVLTLSVWDRGMARVFLSVLPVYP